MEFYEFIINYGQTLLSCSVPADSCNTQFNLAIVNMNDQQVGNLFSLNDKFHLIN